MRVSSTPIILNKQRNEKSNSPNRVVKNQAASNVFMHRNIAYAPQQINFGTANTLLYKVPFLNAISKHYGIISPYTGRPMFPPSVFKTLSNQLSSKAPAEFTRLMIQTIKKPENKQCLSKTQLAVFNRIKKAHNENPDMNLYELIREMHKTTAREVQVAQINHLNQIDLRSKKLSKTAQQDFQTVTTKAILERTERKVDIAWNEELGYNFNKIITKHYKAENRHIMNHIIKEFNAMPNSADAFIAEHARPIRQHNTLQDLHKRLKQIKQNIVSQVGNEEYSKIRPFILNLKRTINDCDNYSNEKKALINIIKRLDTIENDKQSAIINEIMQELPEETSFTDTVLKKEMNKMLENFVRKSTMSAEHLETQSYYSTLLDKAPDHTENRKLRDSLDNLIIADTEQNSIRSDESFASFISKDPKIISTYFPRYFNSIFNLFTSGKLSKSFLPELDRQIASVENFSNGLIQIKNPFKQTIQ